MARRKNRWLSKQNKFVLFMISMSLSTRVTFFEGKSIFLYYSESLSPTTMVCSINCSYASQVRRSFAWGWRFGACSDQSAGVVISSSKISAKSWNLWRWKYDASVSRNFCSSGHETHPTNRICSKFRNWICPECQYLLLMLRIEVNKELSFLIISVFQ